MPESLKGTLETKREEGWINRTSDAVETAGRRSGSLDAPDGEMPIGNIFSPLGRAMAIRRLGIVDELRYLQGMRAKILTLLLCVAKPGVVIMHRKEVFTTPGD